VRIRHCLSESDARFITLTAGVLSIKNIFWQLTSKPGQVFIGYLDSALMAIFIVGAVLVVCDAVRRW
jgi:ethanolamine utilization microcompartment shell protein EutS